MEMLKRYRGCLLAGGVGDQLGNDVEFMKREQMLVKYGPEGVHEMSAYITDDTQMTLFTAEGMLQGLAHNMPMPACVYQSYLDWYSTQGGRKNGVYHKESRLLKDPRLHALRAPGGTCLTALGSGKMGEIDEPINNSKGCGGVMRTAPCGLLKMPELPDNGDAYILQGAMAGAITHSHPMGYIPAGVLADIVHQILLEDGRTLETIVMDSLQRMKRVFGETPVVWAFEGMMLLAVQLAKMDMTPYECIRQLGGGWVGDEALAIAVYCVLKFPDDMEACLSAAVTHDGDSDSTGAIAGNILGAWLGVDAIPERWLQQLEMHEVIDEMACRLYEAANK